MLNDLIIKIINRGISDQHDLSEKLKSHGYDLTQSSISRKLKQLGIIKINGEYKISRNEAQDKKITFVAPNMIVIITPPGHAQAVAALIDDNLVNNLEETNFIGCIAGDDTIFVAISLEGKDSSILIEKLRKLVD